MKNTLVLGIGNEILTDDGIGPRLLTDLHQNDFPDNVHFKNLFLGGLEILEEIQGYDKVLFVDAIITEKGIPGSVYHFTPDDFKETLHLSNFHDANFLTALELGKKMNMVLPSEIHIIAIEIIEDRVFSDQFSPEISKKYPQIFQDVRSLITRLIRI